MDYSRVAALLGSRAIAEYKRPKTGGFVAFPNAATTSANLNEACAVPDFWRVIKSTWFVLEAITLQTFPSLL